MVPIKKSLAFLRFCVITAQVGKKKEKKTRKKDM